MFCGFLSIIHSAENHFRTAALLIVLAAVFDAIDGIMARLTKSSSQFGVEIDSLADIVSFGVAPAFLAYSVHLFTFDTYGIILASLLLIMGGIRLARFNVQLVGYEKEYFTGLPIPASAVTIVSFVLAFAGDLPGFNGLAAEIFSPLVILISLLMVSTVKYDTLPKLTRKNFQARPYWMSSIILAAMMLLITKGEALFYLCSAFIAFGIFRALFEWIRKMSEDQILPEPDSEETKPDSKKD